MAFLLSKRLFKKHPRKCKSEIVFSSTLPEGLLEKNPVQWQQQEATLCMSDMSKKVVDTLPKRGRSKTGPIDISVSTWTLPRGTKNKVEHSFHRSLDDMSTPKGNRVYLNGGPVRPAPLPPSKKPSRKAPKPPASKQTTTGTISYSEQQLYDAPGLCMQHSPLMPGPPSSPLPPPVPTSPRPTSTSRIHSLSKPKLIPQPSLPEDSIYELAPLPTSSTINHQEVPPPLPARINQSGNLPPKPPSTLRIPSLKPPAPPPTQPPRSRPAPPLPPVPPIPPKPAYMREPMEGINSTYCDLDSIQEACHNIHQVKVDKVEDENEDDVYTEMSAIGGNHMKEEEEEEEEDEEEEEEEVEEEYSLMEYKAPERKEVFMNRIKEFEESFKSCVLPPLPPKAVPPETHYSKNVPKYFPSSHVQQQQASFPISLPAGQTENSVDTYEPVLYDDYDDETQEIYY